MSRPAATDEERSGCPINLAVELLGDRWSFLILRDIIFADRRYFRQLLSQSSEGIASNILADRLKRLVSNGILIKTGDADHKQKARYSLTERGIALVPVLAALGIWGRRHPHADELLCVGAKVLEAGGASAIERLMQELREEHLVNVEATPPRQAARPTVREEIGRNYEALAAARLTNAKPRRAGARKTSSET